jgi:hypothetical protein
MQGGQKTCVTVFSSKRRWFEKPNRSKHKKLMDKEYELCAEPWWWWWGVCVCVSLPKKISQIMTPADYTSR